MVYFLVISSWDLVGFFLFRFAGLDWVTVWPGSLVFWDSGVGEMDAGVINLLLFTLGSTF